MASEALKPLDFQINRAAPKLIRADINGIDGRLPKLKAGISAAIAGHVLWSVIIVYLCMLHTGACYGSDEGVQANMNRVQNGGTQIHMSQAMVLSLSKIKSWTYATWDGRKKIKKS